MKFKQYLTEGIKVGDWVFIKNKDVYGEVTKIQKGDFKSREKEWIKDGKKGKIHPGKLETSYYIRLQNGNTEEAHKSQLKKTKKI